MSSPEQRKRHFEEQRRYMARNPEKRREYRRRWRNKNREAVRLANRIWREQNREKRAAIAKAWRESFTPQDVLKRNIHNVVYRAVKSEAIHSAGL